MAPKGRNAEMQIRSIDLTGATMPHRRSYKSGSTSAPDEAAGLQIASLTQLVQSLSYRVQKFEAAFALVPRRHLAAECDLREYSCRDHCDRSQPWSCDEPRGSRARRQQRLCPCTWAVRCRASAATAGWCARACDQLGRCVVAPYPVRLGRRG